jgi:hypothetical protein
MTPWASCAYDGCMSEFAFEFLLSSLRDFRAWFGVAGIILGGAAAVRGTPILLPTWSWFLIAVGATLWMAINARWQLYQANNKKIVPNMKLADALPFLVGSEELFAGNSDRTADALLEIREKAHLKQIQLWGRRNVQTRYLNQYTLEVIEDIYWRDFGIDYLEFHKSKIGATSRVRGQSTVGIQDNIYIDIYLNKHQVDGLRSRKPKVLKLQNPFRWEA